MDTNLLTYSPEWFQYRRGKFTASNCWKLTVEPRTKQAKESGELSETTNTYILEKCWEILSGQTTSNIDNASTQWGVEQEPNAKKWYTKLTGNEIQEATLYELGNLCATPDGLIGEDGLIEIKCPYNGGNHLANCFIESDMDFISQNKEYYWQIQCQLLVTGRKWCDFVSFDPRIDSKLGMFILRINAERSAQDFLEAQSNKAKFVLEKYIELFK